MPPDIGEPPEDDVPPTVDKLLEVVEVERLDRDLFRGQNPAYRQGDRLFGGQVAAQALRAATHTVEVDHHPHSLHGYFLRPGRPGQHTVLYVDRIRDGRSFTTRRVVAVQNGEAIFSLSASFHRDEPGGEYATPVPAEARGGPEDRTHEQENPFRGFDTMSPFEIREQKPPAPDERGVLTSTRRLWVRTRGPLPDDRHLHACVLTFISDMGAVFAARLALGPVTPHNWGMGASLDHAIWFHRHIRPDDWVLFDLRPVSNAGSRGLVVGTMHAADGTHGASMTQEAVIRTGPPTG